MGQNINIWDIRSSSQLPGTTITCAHYTGLEKYGIFWHFLFPELSILSYWCQLETTEELSSDQLHNWSIWNFELLANCIFLGCLVWSITIYVHERCRLGLASQLINLKLLANCIFWMPSLNMKYEYGEKEWDQFEILNCLQILVKLWSITNRLLCQLRMLSIHQNQINLSDCI